MITEDLVEYIRTNCWQDRGTGCDECNNLGDCCLQCDFRKDCPGICSGERHHERLEMKPDGELADMLEDQFELGLLMLTAAERIRELSKRLDQLMCCETCDLYDAGVCEFDGTETDASSACATWEPKWGPMIRTMSPGRKGARK